MNLEPPVIAALVTGTVSLIIAVITFFSSRANQRDVEKLKADLAERKSERDARRDYVYEARKRLYQECEPLLFQLYEMSIGGMKRIRSLARTARDGDLGPDKISWLSNEGYYTLSTIYMLMAPLTILKLIQQRLTLVDLTVDPKIKAQYLLARNLYLTFTADFKLAKQSPALEYNPHLAESRDAFPAIHWRQGFAVGRLDKAISALLLSDGNRTNRCMSFGEFESTYHNQNSSLHHDFQAVLEIFLDFHPKSRPILWRILIAQLHIYKAIARVSESNYDEPQSEVLLPRRIPDEKRKDFDWRQQGDEATDNEVLIDPFVVAESYLNKKLYRQAP